MCLSRWTSKGCRRGLSIRIKLIKIDDERASLSDHFYLCATVRIALQYITLYTMDVILNLLDAKAARRSKARLLIFLLFGALEHIHNQWRTMGMRS